ncbi:hypothetical protein DFH27DRAFT_604593 [Peziza echinospora]|nr:hypothetical protein DFH27DRAFT_604593 [Peziza echinospora]
MLQYLSPLKARLSKKVHHEEAKPAVSPDIATPPSTGPVVAITTTTTPTGTTTPAPAPAPAQTAHHHNHNTANLTPLLTPTDERFLASVIDPDGENVILPGSPVVVEPPSTPLSTTAAAAAPVPVPVVDPGEPAWKEELRAKWGYLGSLKDASVTRLGQFVGGEGESVKEDGKDKESKKSKKEKEKEKEKKKDIKGKGKQVPDSGVEPPEILQEDQDLSTILETLSLSASQGRVFSLPSASLKPLIDQFTQILKDLLVGVPTAYDDLVALFTDSSTLFQKTYDNLPSFLKQMIATLPDKMTPEVLRTLAATSPVVAERAAGLTGLGLKEIVTTPGILADLLRSVVAALRLRFPMLMGGGVAVGLGVFVVLFGLWYCYKRGVETREEREERERMETFGVEKILSEEEIRKAEQGKAKEAAAAAAAAAEGGEKKKKKWWR